MGGRKKTAIKNSSVGFLGQIISLILQIISRKYFITFIGEEILGLNGTFASILSTLSLAELGIQNAISYALYRPISEGKKEDINDIVNVYKLVYRVIGSFFIVGSVAALPTLKFFVKGVEVTPIVYVYFLVQAMATSCTYFLAYKRTVLYADQKDYICKAIDLVSNVIFKLAQIFVIVRLHSYLLYITIQMVQVYLTNLVVHLACKKQYPYLKKSRINRKCAKEILGNVKDIFVGRIAKYVYNSTDNLIISKVLGTVFVARFGNYSTITANIHYLLDSIMYPITPTIGNFLAEDNSRERQSRNLAIYTHVRYIAALVLLAPTLVLIDDFIAMWVGKQFILEPLVRILPVVNLYMLLMQGACNDYIVGKGLFKKDKYVTISGAIVNLILSLALVGIMGLSGILIGTVCGQLVNWVGHSSLVYWYGLEEGRKKYGAYVLKNIWYGSCFALTAWVAGKVYGLLPDMPGIARFACGGIIAEFVALALYLALFWWSAEFKELCEMVMPYVKRKLRKEKTGD